MIGDGPQVRYAAALAMIVSASLLTAGCVAAAIPVVAGTAIARQKMLEPSRPEAGRVPPKSIARVATSGPEVADPPLAATVVPTTLKALPPPDGTMAGDDASLRLQSYHPLWAYLVDQAGRHHKGEEARSVVMAAGATLDTLGFTTCAGKPLAVIFDLDEDPAGSDDPDARWRRWNGDGSDMIVAAPGAVEAIAATRRLGMTVIFTTARDPAGAAGVVAALNRLGFGNLEPGRTLLLRGTTAGDTVRRSIATSHCPIAMVGDALQDFSDLFPASPETDSSSATADITTGTPLSGAGWFLLPNPVRSIAASNSSAAPQVD